MKNHTNTMRLSTIALLVGIALFGETVHAQDQFGRLMAKWRVERDELVISITRSWLRGAPAASLRSDVANLVTLESRLAVDGTIPLYMTSLSDAKDPDKVLADLVRAFLRRRNIEFQTNDFLVGKDFQIIRQERAVLPVEPQKQRPSFRFQLWKRDRDSKEAASAKSTSERK